MQGREALGCTALGVDCGITRHDPDRGIVLWDEALVRAGVFRVAIVDDEV